MPSNSADSHLLFGLLALQNGLISREQLVAAFAKWTSNKSVPVDAILLADGAIEESTCRTLRQLVELHVQRNGGNPQQSLMALSGSDLPVAKEQLARLGDSQLQQSMAAIQDSDPAATVPPTVGQPTSGGGRFRILRPLPGAHGGMGVISVARDEELGRQVALKQILADKADHTGYRQKFQVEAEITGNLEHPGIVPVYGLGAGPDGRPYYAMRLVYGDNLRQRIKDFHAASESSADYSSVEFFGLIDRLIDVAQATRYAHSRGVLHRDLKPGNILVGEYGETLVIDWGLARLPQSEQEECTFVDGMEDKAPLQIRSGSQVDATMQGQALGTVGYAPPEQLNGRIDLISPRSDVYALGAILYEILLGHRPLETSENRPLAEQIKDTIAGNIVPPRKIHRSIPKALSAICMKAMRCDPADRYPSVGALIEELDRWKADQPVEAAPDSWIDRGMRLARRYRTAALAAAMALVVIALVTGGALVVVNRAKKEAQQLAVERTQLAERNQMLAERNQTVVDAFVAAFHSADPDNEGVTIHLTALEVLEQARAQIDGDEKLARDELAKATLLSAIGSSLSSLGQYDSAISAIEESLRLQKAKLGVEHLDTLTSMNDLANSYAGAGRLDESLPLFEETFRLIKAKLGAEHPDTLMTMNNLALAYKDAGRLDAALPLFEETLRLQQAMLGAEHPDTHLSMHNLAGVYKAAGRWDEALPLYEETLRLFKSKLGAEHPSTLASMSGLALAYKDAGRLDEALPLLVEAVRLKKAKLGAEHPSTLGSMNNLAVAYKKAGRLDEALPLLLESLRLTKAKLGGEHPLALASMNNLADAYQAAGRLDAALPLLEETLRLLKAKLGAEHPQTLVTMNNLAVAYKDAGRLDEALPLHEESLRLQKAKLGTEHPDTLTSIDNLASVYASAGRLDEALPLYEETLQLSKSKLGAEHPRTLSSVRGLQAALLQAGDYDAARVVVEEWIAILDQSPDVDLSQLARANMSLAETLLGLGFAEEASQQIDSAAELDELKGLQRTRANSIRGAVLASQDKWEEAEPLLVESAETLAERLEDIKIDLRWYASRACERVIAMYEAWDKPADAEKWRAKLADVNAEITRLRNSGMPSDAR